MIFLVQLVGCTTNASAQTGRIKILEIFQGTALLKVSEGNAVTTARGGMSVAAQAMICPADDAKNKLGVTLQPEEGGDVRVVYLGGGASCKTATKAYEEASRSPVSFVRAMMKLAKREGGDTVRASASIAGGTRGGDIVRTADSTVSGTQAVETKGNPAPSGTANDCLLEQIKPMAKSLYIYLPEGRHALTFATNMPDAQGVEVVDSAGTVISTAKASGRRLDLPAIAYARGAEYTVRSQQDARCNVTISVNSPPESVRFEQALAVAPDADTAKALYADVMMDTDDQALWHAYALSMIKLPQSPGAMAGPESTASWKKWWAYWQAEAAKTVTQ